jgi:hypothetical protein
METTLLKSLGQIAGIGGIALGVFLVLLKNILKKLKVPGLKQAQWFKIVIILMVLVWSIAALGVAAWVYAETNSSDPRAMPKTVITTTASGPFSPAITAIGSNSSVSVSYSLGPDDKGKQFPQYELYFQKMKAPASEAIPDELYEIGFKNITEKPLLNFEFAIHFKEQVESVQYDFGRSSANLAGGDYLSSDGMQFHWRGNQIMENGG